MKNTSKYFIILLVILIGGFAARLYRFDNPIADWHSWRQADTSAVSRNFVQDGFDLLHPRMDNISNVQSGLDNPQGYFFVEFPIYNAAQAGLYKLFGFLTLEEWGRLITITSSMITCLFLYLLVSRHSNKAIGLWSAFFYSFIPFNIYYGRVILVDPSMVMAVTGGIYFFDRWLNSNSKSKVQGAKFYLLALVFTTLAFLLKPVAVFFVLPMIVLAWQKFGWRLLLQWPLWLFAVVSVTPLIWWRTWMMQYPEGIPANTWLLNGNGIRFRPAFFRWIFYERLTKLISGYFGMVFVLVGIYKLAKQKDRLFFASFLVSSLLYVCVFATGNVQHDYYQIPIMPSIAIIFAIGSYYLSQWSFRKLPIGRVLLALCLVGGFYFSWQQVQDYFNINNRSIIVAGEAIDRLIPKDAKIIVNYNGDSSFLYQTKRKGWASFEKPIEEMVQMGASYLVLANPTQTDMGLARDYKVVSLTPEYVLFDLKKE